MKEEPQLRDFEDVTSSILEAKGVDGIESFDHYSQRRFISAPAAAFVWIKQLPRLVIF